VAAADVVFGGRRHLELAAELVGERGRTWPSPFDGAVDAVVAERGRAVCVLASGDPFQHGIGPLLAERMPPCEWLALPAPSAFSLAAARLGWSLPRTALLSVHGRDPAALRPQLHAGARVLALTSGAHGPTELAKLLCDHGFGESRLHVLEALGGPRERVRTQRADEPLPCNIDPLNVLAIEVEASAQARVIPRAAGLPDAWFEHDGQLTKRELRALALASLAPRRGELLWDVGAGAGSIAIEWLLADPQMRAIAIERSAERAARIDRNAAALGVPQLRLIQGTAPAALCDLPRPDAIFVGGGAGDPAVLESAIAALAPGGRLVAHAVTLQSEQQLLARHAAQGGDLVRLEIARSAPLGGLSAWQPARPITQWTWPKP
jgi:precorrin-6Y C5,15-methyltransferase (decarboxylating)